MRNYLIFILTLALPLVVLSVLSYENRISAEVFTVLMLLYAFFYHPIVSVIRLIALNKIPRKKFWVALIPFWNWKYSSDAVFLFKS